MKEIKFRARNLPFNNWAEADLLLTHVPCKTTKKEFATIKFGNGEGQYDLQMYTGLKDKNGKEIFEGDILDCSYINLMSKKHVKRLYKVVFEDGCFKVKCVGHSPYGDTHLYFVNEIGVVIGNIYENPELFGGVENERH